MKNAARMLVNKLPQLGAAVSLLAKRDVLVGVPKDETDRKESDEKEPMNNATLAYIHDNGSPAANIPARPFMQPGIEAAKSKVTAHFKSAARGALSGGDVELGLNRAGLVAQASIRNEINQGIGPELADSTLRARIRNRTSIEGAKAELKRRAETGVSGTDLAKPLIATAQLRNSINYVIRSK